MAAILTPHIHLAYDLGKRVFEQKFPCKRQQHNWLELA